MLRALAVTAGVGIVVGTFTSAISDVFPSCRMMLQRGGGGLLVGGIALLGFAAHLI